MYCDTRHHRAEGSWSDTICRAKSFMATIFWDSSRVLLVDFLEHGHTVNQCWSVLRLCEEPAPRHPRERCVERWSLILVRTRPDLTPLSTSTATAPKVLDGSCGITLRTVQIWLLPTFTCFLSRKSSLSGTRFSCEVEAETGTKLATGGTASTEPGMDNLVLRSDKCLNQFWCLLWKNGVWVSFLTFHMHFYPGIFVVVAYLNR